MKTFIVTYEDGKNVITKEMTGDTIQEVVKAVENAGFEPVSVIDKSAV